MRLLQLAHRCLQLRALIIPDKPSAFAIHGLLRREEAAMRLAGRSCVAV
jgi:hypothetical protein